MINGEISIVNVGDQIAIAEVCKGIFEVHIGNAPIVNINQEQAVNLRVALNKMFPPKVIVQNRLPVFMPEY